MGQIEIIEKQEISFIPKRLSHHENIIRLLKSNSGLTIADISRILEIARNTVVVSLAKLEGARQVNIKKIGMAKIYSFKPEFQIKKEVNKK